MQHNVPNSGRVKRLLIHHNQSYVNVIEPSISEQKDRRADFARWAYIL